MALDNQNGTFFILPNLISCSIGIGWVGMERKSSNFSFHRNFFFFPNPAQ
jgi:hypothetical protein